MCDSIVVVAGGETWLAKNSDREPGEAQAVSWVPGAPAPSSRHARRRCTHVSVADRGRRRAVVLSRPSWMWGAEMGVNESGLAVANEAVFTRMPVAQQGLTSITSPTICSRCGSRDTSGGLEPRPRGRPARSAPLDPGW